MRKDYYKILGVEQDASKEDIKKSFRALSKKYHPDVGGDESKFKEINEAYRVLFNDEERAKYDSAGNGLNYFGDLFNNLRSGFNVYRSRNRWDGSPVRGPNLRFFIDISLYEAVCGGSHELSYQIKDICDNCGGAGGFNKVICDVCGGNGFIKTENMSDGIYMLNESVCSTCGGKGFIMNDRCDKCDGAGYLDVDKHISVMLPSEVRDGTVVRISGAGNAGQNGGPYGDIFVKFRLKMPNKNNLTPEQLEVLKVI